MIERKVLAWCLYDLANTSFSALIVTIFFPALIIGLGGNEFHVGLVMGVSLLLAALIVPLIGGISDVTRVKRKFIIFFSLLTIFATAGIYFGNLWIALLLGTIANLFYHASLDIYDSLLPEVSEVDTIGKISGLGVSFGYVGTILSLVMTWVIMYFYGWNTMEGTRIMFVATGIFFLIFAIPLFLVRDKYPRFVSYGEGLKKGWKNVFSTLTEIKKYRNLWIFFLSSFLFVNAVSTIIAFLYLYGSKTLGLAISDFFPIYAGMSVTAVFGSVIFGKLSDKLRAKRTLKWILFLWILIIGMLVFKTNYGTYLAAGLIGGALLGGVWTTTRHLMIEVAPPKKMAELFGFQGLTEKLGGIGPLVFGYLVVVSGYDLALKVTLGCFIVGLFFLLFVKENEIYSV